MIIRLLFILRRRWPIVLLVPLVAAGLGLVFTPTDEARSAVVYRSEVSVAGDPEVLDRTAINQDIIEARQGEVATVTAEGTDLTPTRVRSLTSTRFDDVAFVITVTGRGPDPDAAEELAATYAEAFETINNGASDEQRATRLLIATTERDEARAAVLDFLNVTPTNENGQLAPTAALQLDLLNSARASAEAAYDEVASQPIDAPPYRIIGQADARLVESQKLELPASRLLRVTLGLLLGIIAAALLVALVERLNPRIDDPDHASELIGAPVLAMVPVMSRRRQKQILRADPATFNGPFAESFRSMRAHLDFRARADDLEKPPRVMVTSATPSEGKSTASAFIALSYAEVNRPPVVIGGDLRRPSVHKIFDVPRVPGLSTRVALGGDTMPLSEIVKTDPLTGVSVVPSGPRIDRVTGVLQDMIAVASAGQEAGRVVIVDTPPVMVANDATDFLAAVDWVVVVVRVGRSTERSVKQMMTTLNLNEAKVVGVVMVGSVESSDAQRYYYSYYAPDDDDGQGQRPMKVQDPADASRPVETTGEIPPPPGDAPTS